MTLGMFNTLLQSRWNGCHNTLFLFFRDPLKSLMNSLF